MFSLVCFFLGLKALSETMPSNSKKNMNNAIPLIEKIGQKIIIGFEGLTVNDPGVKKVMTWSARGLIGGVILFARNIHSKDQVTALIHALKKSSKYPLFICIDQEGGKVQRLRASNGFTDYRSAYDVAKTMTPKQAEAYYEKLALELRNTGFNCNFAPVIDLQDGISQQRNDVIGGHNRAFSSDVKEIISYASSFIKAHKKANVITCLKHYPGHGLASTDSHIGPADISHTFNKSERIPFKELIKTDYEGMIMVGHLTHKKIDALYPVSLSKIFIQDWLRKEDKFHGAIITDDLLMGAITLKFGFVESVLKAIEAGVDLLLFSASTLVAKEENLSENIDIPTKIIECVMQACKKGTLTTAHINDSYSHIAHLKQKNSLF